MEECARMNCDNEAVALLTFAPQQAKAWLYDLHEANPTGGIMLCRKHANATVVPMSWQLVDARDPAWPGPSVETAAEPSVAETMSTNTMSTNTMSADLAPMVDRAMTNASYGLPSDAGTSRGLSAHDGPVVPEPYAEPRAATLRAAGVLTDAPLITEPTVDADMSLFQLPLADVPAVTPHPDHH